jgi:hypothetical protein
VQETLKEFQDNKNRELEKAQEQIKETIKALYKHQSETKNTISKEMNSGQKQTLLKRKRLRIWKSSEKRTKQKCKTKWKANLAD